MRLDGFAVFEAPGIAGLDKLWVEIIRKQGPIA
jgi:hypothetical protein